MATTTLAAVATVAAEAPEDVVEGVPNRLAVLDRRHGMLHAVGLKRRAQKRVQLAGVQKHASHRADVDVDAILVDVVHGLAVPGARDGHLPHRRTHLRVTHVLLQSVDESTKRTISLFQKMFNIYL